MNTNLKKLLCIVAAILMLTGCRSGGGETTAPTEQTTVPTVTKPNVGSAGEWDGTIGTDPIETAPIETTAPQPDTTEPSESTNQPAEQTDPTQPPVQNTEPPVQNTEPPVTTQPQTGGSDAAALTYEEYLAMSPAEQQAHYETFPSLEAYIAWHNAALAEYEENQNSIEVTGSFDIGDFMNP